MWVLLMVAAYMVYESMNQSQSPIDWGSLVDTSNSIVGGLVSNLESFANAITNFEGQPGDLNYRNNNPGNLKYAGQAGAIGQDSNGFAIFDTWSDGMAALQKQIALDASRNPNWTITDFVNSYAPPSDNNPNNANYANSIALALGVSPNATLGSLELNA